MVPDNADPRGTGAVPVQAAQQPASPDQTMQKPGPPSPPARQRPSTGVVVFALVWVAVQVAVPVAQLDEERPARWGWQMFSQAEPAPRLIGHRADGAEVPLRARDYFVRYRWESTNYAEPLAAVACRTERGLVAVSVQPHSAPAATSFPCSPVSGAR